MLEGGGGGGDQGMSIDWKVQGVKWPGDIAPNDQFPGQENLRRKTKGVKLHRKFIIGSELTNGNKVLNKFRGNKNIIKTQRTSGASRSDWKKRTITDNNGGWSGRQWW